jgi:exopolysaccharide biosynthesis protein
MATDALEGGPLLIHEGRPVPLKGFNWTILHGKEPRTAVGLTAAGEMLWITVDGRRPGHSMGTSLDELTRLFLSLGAVEAMNWDGGGSTTMVLPGGNVVSKIATGWVREVSNALVLLPATASVLVAGA